MKNRKKTKPAKIYEFFEDSDEEKKVTKNKHNLSISIPPLDLTKKRKRPTFNIQNKEQKMWKDTGKKENIDQTIDDFNDYFSDVEDNSPTELPTGTFNNKSIKCSKRNLKSFIRKKNMNFWYGAYGLEEGTAKSREIIGCMRNKIDESKVGTPEGYWDLNWFDTAEDVKSIPGKLQKAKQ